MSRNASAEEYFGLTQMGRGESSQQRPKGPKTSKNISPQAAKAQTSNQTNRMRQSQRSSKNGY